MTKKARRVRDHVGAKNGGGFWGKRAEAKKISKKARRERDIAEEKIKWES